MIDKNETLLLSKMLADADNSKRTYSVTEIQEMLGIGKNQAYTLVKSGEFKTVKIGNSIRISKKSFDEWLDN